MKTYRANVTREDGYWVAVVEGLRGGATETRTFAALEDEVRDLVAGLTDTDEDSFGVELQLSDELKRVRDAIAAMERMREAVSEMMAEYAVTQRQVARTLHEEHLSARDSAKLIGVSHQRISQLLNS